MPAPVVLQRPVPIRAAAAITLAIITAWAALDFDNGGFGVYAYPAIIALQTAREFMWRLEVSRDGLVEKQGVGPTREIAWKQIENVVMPDTEWWRINPAMKVKENPNIQMTAGDGLAEVLEITRRRRREIIGNPASVSLVKSLTPWLILMGLSSLLLGGALASGGTT